MMRGVTGSQRTRWQAVAMAAAVVALPVAGASGASATWNGATDSAWSTTGNWSASPVPGTANTATFNNAGNSHTTIDLGAGVTISSISFDTALAAAYTIGSGGVGSQTLTLNNSGSIVMSSSVVSDELVNAKITLGTDATAQTYTFTNNSTTNSLTLAGAIAGGTGGTAAAKTLSVNGAGATNISGVISNGGATSVGLSKSGSGTLTLNGAAVNTYTGGTSVTAGTLQLDFSNLGTATNLISSSSVLTTGGGTLKIVGKNGAATSQTFASWTVSGNTQSSIQVMQNGASGVSLSLGTLTRGGGGIVDLALPTTGSITTSNFSSGGVLVSASSNGIAFATVDGTDWASVSSGTLGKLSSYAVDTFGASANVNVTADDTPAAFAINTLKFGTTGKTLTLNSSGVSTINTGGLLVPSGVTATIDGTGAAALRGGTGRELAVINNGNLEFKVPVTDSSNGAASITLGGTGTTTFSAANTNTGSLNQPSSAATLDLNGVVVSTGGGTLSGTVTGTGGLTKTGTGVLAISATNNNDYSGGTLIRSGAVQIGSSTVVSGGTVTGGPLGTGTITFSGGSMLAVRANPVTLANDVSASGFLEVSGAGAAYSLNFGGQTGYTSSFTLAGDTTFYNDNTTVNFKSDITGAGDFALAGGGGSAITTVSGAVNMDGRLMASNVVMPTVSAAGVTVSGAVGPRVTSVVQDSTSRLALTNVSNSYSGPTLVYSGALQAVSGTSLPAASNLVLDGGVFQSTASTFTRSLGASGSNTVQFGVRGGGFAANGMAVSINIGGNATPDTLTWGATNFLPDGSPLILGSTSANNALTVQNPLDLNGKTQTIAVIAGSGDSETLAGVISNGSLIKNGNGTLTLSAANSNNISATIASGTLTLSATGTLGAGSNITFGSSIPGVSDGSGAALNRTIAGGGTGTFNRISPSVGTNLTLGTLTFSAGDSTVTSTYGSSGNASLTFSSLATRGAGATGNFNIPVGSGTNGTTNKIVLSGAAAGAFIDAGLFFSGSNFAWYDAAGYVRGINYASDNGAVNLTATTASTTGTYIKTTSSITAQNTATFATLNLAGTSTTGANNSLTLNANQTLTVSGILRSGNTAVSTGATAISGGTGIQAPSNADLIVRTDLGNDTLTISTPILANGTNNLVKSGAGTLTLSATNSYTGTTYVNAGTLNLGAAGVIPGNVVINGGTLSGGSGNSFAAAGSTQITLNAGTFSVGGGAVIAGYTQYGGSGNCNPQNSAVSMTVHKSDNSGTTTIAGGTFYLAGNQGSTWATDKLVLSGGAMFIDVRSAQGPIKMTVSAGGMMEIDQPADGPFTPITFRTTIGTNYSLGGITPTLTLDTGAGVKFVGDSRNSNTTYITSVGNALNQGSISLVAGSHTFDIGRGGATGSDLAIQSPISGAGGLAKSGAGALELAFANTYSGTTLVNNGTLLVSGMGSINSSSGITVDGGTFRYSSTATLTKSVAFGVNGGRFVYDSPSALTTLPTLSSGATFIYNSSAKLGGALNVASGQTVGGSGVLADVTSAGGTIAPGNSAGTLTMDSLSMDTSSKLLYDLSATNRTRGAGINDYIVVSGNLTLDGEINLSSLTALSGGTYTLIHYTGTLLDNGLNIGSTFDTTGGSRSYEIVADTANQDINLVVTIPEPVTVGLFLGIGALATMSRRRRVA